MRKRHFLLIVTGLVVLGCAILVLWLLFPAMHVSAQVPPPPSKEPVEPPTAEPTDEPTAEPTDEPTAEPTDEPTAEPTDEPTEEPTAEPPAEEPVDEPTEEPTSDAPSKPSAALDSKPNPRCQSSVEGRVTDQSGRGVVGATVSIEGEGVSRKLLTGDTGNYGFGGLCAGTVTLSAALPGGQMSPSVSVELDGQNSLNVNLGLESSNDEASPSPTVPESSAQQALAQEPSMPVTGFPGGVLLSGMLFGMLILTSVTVGIRRSLRAK